MNDLIGITGGIGAGKSVVSRILRLLGYPVYDCDLEARRIMDSDRLLIGEIESRLGPACVDPSGKLCRRAIADVIFADTEARLWLNSRVHAAVRGDLIRFASGGNISSYTANPAELIFVESAILQSSGLASLCSRIWIVDAAEEIRIDRVMLRSGISRESVRQRIESQRSEFEFPDDLYPGDFIRRIDNSPSIQLLPQILGLLNEYL